LTSESFCKLYDEKPCGITEQGFMICVPQPPNQLHCNWTDCIDIGFPF
jgi:hypothetical protein